MATRVRTTRSDAGKKRHILGTLLKRTRLRRRLSLRDVASKAGISAMYLSLLERDACEPSSEALNAVVNALGESHAEMFFARAGRLHPRLIANVMRHPFEWVGLLEAGENASSAQLRGLKALLGGAAGISRSLALLDTIRAVETKGRVERRRSAARGAAGEELPHSGWLIVQVAKGLPVSFRPVKQILEAELGSDYEAIPINRPEMIKQFKKILDENPVAN